MTISIWRYSHLALAVSSFLFILLASLTGIILAIEPVADKSHPYKSAHFNDITLVQTVDVLKRKYSEVTELKVNEHQFVIITAVSEDGDDVNGYIDPATGEYRGDVLKQSAFFQFITTLHRSLFLHGVGRFFVGLTAFLLLLIAVSGTVLIIQRQRGITRFFSKMVNENFFQYYHALLGRLSLPVIIIITSTGIYLSLLRFEVVPEIKATHNINFDAIREEPKQAVNTFPFFVNTKLSEVTAVAFPFSDDVEDYYTIKLKDREVIINQYTGEVLSELRYPWTAIAISLSMTLHTGRGSRIWAVVLAIASVNILFFIYSGFAITLRRRLAHIKNKYTKDESKYIILVGSENGSTLRFASELHQQLLRAGETAYLTELNNYDTFPKAKHLLIITATYGKGNPPSNAAHFLKKLEQIQQSQPIHYAVAGLGSLAYPDFCRFAIDVNHALAAQSWAASLLKLHTIHDKSFDAFDQWAMQWAQQVGIKIKLDKDQLITPPKATIQLKVTGKTTPSQIRDTFLIQLQPVKKHYFTSGDLLAVYPANDYRERQYSIGKLNDSLQLTIKLHAGGLGSGYLYSLQPNDVLRALIISNASFHFPKKATRVLLISNGTGIAPFLGMIDQNDQHTEIHLYCGFRNEDSFDPYKQSLEANKASNKLHQLHLAYSRQHSKNYVHDLIERDELLFADTLKINGVIMICGSLAMQEDTEHKLEALSIKYNHQPLNYYRDRGQIRTDCY